MVFLLLDELDGWRPVFLGPAEENGAFNDAARGEKSD
jgi:hypothetical protein